MPQKEIKHILETGGSLAVALPRGWLRFHELQKGDVVEVITNGEIKIRPFKDEKNE